MKKRKKGKSVGISITDLIDKQLNRAPDYKKSYGSDFDITVPIRKPKGELKKMSARKKIKNMSKTFLK